MDDGSNERQGLKGGGDGQDSGGSGSDDTGLPIQPANPEGSSEHTDIRTEGGLAGTHTPLPDDDGQSATGSRGGDSRDAMPSNGGGLRDDGQWHGEYRLRGKIPSVQSPQGNQDAELTDVENRHLGQTKEAIARPTKTRIRSKHGVLKSGAGAQLEALVPKALSTLEDIIDKEVDEMHPDYSKILSIKRQASTDILAAQTKVDENFLRAKQADGLQKLLDAFRKEELKMTLVNPVI